MNDPADHPRAEMLAGMVNELTAEIARLRAEFEQTRAALDEARDRLPEGERWCMSCSTYEDDYRCACAECAECGAKLPGVERWWVEMTGEAHLCAACEAAERAEQEGRAQDAGR